MLIFDLNKIHKFSVYYVIPFCWYFPSITQISKYILMEIANMICIRLVYLS